MSLREMIEHPPNISDIPVWRKLLIACGLLFFLFVGAATVDHRLTIYGTAPDHPVVATGQIYEVSAMGRARYVTLAEKEGWLEGRAGSWGGAAIVVVFFLWATSPRKSAGKINRIRPFSGPHG